MTAGSWIILIIALSFVVIALFLAGCASKPTTYQWIGQGEATDADLQMASARCSAQQYQVNAEAMAASGSIWAGVGPAWFASCMMGQGWQLASY